MDTFIIAVILITMHFSIVSCRQNVGDVCTINSTGSKGLCIMIDHCQKAVEDLRNHRKYPQTCGFEGTQPLVCCNKSSTPPPPTPSAPPTPPTPPKPTQPIVPTTLQRKTGEISKEKCREYSQYVIERIRIPTLSSDGPAFIERKQCTHKVVPLIIGGERAKTREFPHMALLGYEQAPNDIKWACGGSIISEKYILTAAHCLISKTFGPVKYVLVGVTNLKKRTKYKQQIAVSERIPHPEYISPSRYNDIGLLKLEKPIKLNSYARPACLWGSQEITTEKAIAIGFGATGMGSVTANPSDHLLKVVLDIFEYPLCNYSYRRNVDRHLRNGIIEDTQMCAGSKTSENKDTCMGDSGGALQIYHNDKDDGIHCMYDIIGITSLGQSCPAAAGVFTKVAYYLKWIEDKVWSEVS